MYKVENQTAELLNGAADHDQANFLKYLMRTSNYSGFFKQYITDNIVNRETFKLVFNNRCPLASENEYGHCFYNELDRIYTKVEKKLIPLTYDELVAKFKETENEFKKEIAEFKQFYLAASGHIRSIERNGEGRDFLRKFKYYHHRYFRGETSEYKEWHF
jgi:hypothetical protein